MYVDTRGRRAGLRTSAAPARLKLPAEEARLLSACCDKRNSSKSSPRKRDRDGWGGCCGLPRSDGSIFHENTTTGRRKEEEERERLKDVG